jgi:hypothetical protein
MKIMYIISEVTIRNVSTKSVVPIRLKRRFVGRVLKRLSNQDLSKNHYAINELNEHFVYSSTKCREYLTEEL